MKLRTAITLFIGFFQAGFLCHFFVVLFLQGSYPVNEPVQWIAGMEIVLCLVAAALFLERLFRLREKRS